MPGAGTVVGWREIARWTCSLSPLPGLSSSWLFWLFCTVCLPVGALTLKQQLAFGQTDAHTQMSERLLLDQNQGIGFRL